MIVAPAGGGRWLVITQNDHAHFASELLALWRTDGLPDHPRRRQLLFAAREHDNGWAETDSAPMCDPTSGRPLDFMAVSQGTRQDLWRRGTERYAERDPYAALLIVRHAIHLHRSQLQVPEWSEIFARWHELEAELLERVDVAETALMRDYRWIELTDLLSLAACNGWARELEGHGIRAVMRDFDVPPDGDSPDGHAASGTLLIDPFPLAGATSFQVACRLIPDRRYSGDADLGTELAIARWQHYAVKVAAFDRRGAHDV